MDQTFCHGSRNIICLVTGLFALFLSGPGRCRCEQPDWVLEAQAQWTPRDSQAEWVSGDRLWIGGGWMSSYEAPPRDVWASEDGGNWTMIQSAAPWIHSDLPMNLTFADKMWIMGGWFNGRLPGHSAGNQVWCSDNGREWTLATDRAAWSPRCAGVVVEFRGRMWLMGGTENYYFGDDQSLKNDVWSSAKGHTWKLESAQAAWKPRAYHQAVVLGNRIFLMGGGNYVPNHVARNDVWSSVDGVQWSLETESAPWAPRLWFSAVTYRDRIWVLGGWSKEHGNFGDVWHSRDGRHWQRFQTATCWKPRHEHSALVFRDKLWVAGGHADPLSNEVWSLSLPDTWNPE